MPRPSRVLLAAACAAAASAGAYESCWEVAPGSKGRRRLVLPTWAAARLAPAQGGGPAGAALERLGPEYVAHFNEQRVAGRLPAPPPGRIFVSWSSGAVQGPAALPDQVRAAVNGAAAAAEAALAALAAGVPSACARAAARLQQGGVRVEPVPSPTFYCGASGLCIVLTTGAVGACWRRGAGAGQAGEAEQAAAAQAALLYLLGHELGHILSGHTAEKALVYIQQMMAFSCRCLLADARRRLRRLLAPGAGGAAAAEAAWRVELAALQLRVAAHLQWLSWQQELEADALACRIMGAAGVPPSQWAPQLEVLQGGGAGAASSSEAQQAAEEEEAAAWAHQAAQLAAAAGEQLASGGAAGDDAAQALLDASVLRWPVPAGWLRVLNERQRAELLARLLQTHPPLRRRIEAVRQLAGEGHCQVTF